MKGGLNILKKSPHTATSILKKSLAKGLKRGLKCAATVFVETALDMAIEKFELAHSKKTLDVDSWFITIQSCMVRKCISELNDNLLTHFLRHQHMP